MHSFRTKNRNDIKYAFIVFVIVLLTSLVDMLTRPESGLSVIWSTNAVIVGLFLRYHNFAKPLSWLTAAVALMFSSYLLGEDLNMATLYNMNNLIGAWVAWYLLNRYQPKNCLRTLNSIKSLLSTCLIAAATHAFIGAIITIPSGIKADISVVATNWLFGQFLSYIIFIPSILLISSSKQRKKPESKLLYKNKPIRPDVQQWLPVSLLILSVIVALTIGGSFTLAILITTLVFCTLIYQQSTSVWLAAITTFLITYAIAYYPDPDHFLIYNYNRWSMASLRFGTILIMITPLVISSGIAQHDDMVTSLNTEINHDNLTNALSRGAYFSYANQHLKDAYNSKNGVGILLIDIDHFKNINDTYGHAVGDEVLILFTKTVLANIRSNDLLGRLGGEEFGVVLPNTSLNHCIEAAERIRTSVENLKININPENNEYIKITTSIGLTHSFISPDADLDGLMSQADKAMYKAKLIGRNTINVYTP